MPPRVKVLIAVWGDAYIDAFSQLALPSLMASGNLPALSKATNLSVSILTSHQDQAKFESKPAFNALKSICPVSFIDIDDLVGSSIYGITLTLAYMRGIAAEGENMVNVNFVFFNSDFILAQNSLLSLRNLILAGSSVVIAPSFRAIAEEVEPKLHSMVEQSGGTLAVPARELVSLALKHTHPTVLAKTINQGVCRSLYQNQLYWRVDQDTYLGRFYLMFMLCIRPERVISTVNTYCDYGFVPELCPSSDITYLTDSDDFFMLETQARQHEAEHIRLGAHRNSDDVVGYLSEWTTREHRSYAALDLIFHASDLPAHLSETRCAASALVGQFAEQLSPPSPHAFHPYWVGSLPAWKRQIAGCGKTTEPPELTTVQGDSKSRFLFGRLFAIAHRIVRGSQGNLKPWQAGWVDQRIVNNTLQAIAGKSRADVVLFLNESQLAEDPKSLSSKLLALIQTGECIHLFVNNPGSEFMPALYSKSVLNLALEIFGSSNAEMRLEFTDARRQRKLRLSARRLGQYLVRWGWAGAPGLAVCGTILMISNILNNLFGVIRGTLLEPPDYCGMMILTIKTNSITRDDGLQALKIPNS